jgi:hypothetical protein
MITAPLLTERLAQLHQQDLRQAVQRGRVAPPAAAFGPTGPSRSTRHLAPLRWLVSLAQSLVGRLLAPRRRPTVNLLNRTESSP